MAIANPEYAKRQKSQVEFREISEEELKKNILEKEFERKCEWELRRLGMREGENKQGDKGQGERQGEIMGMGTQGLLGVQGVQGL